MKNLARFGLLAAALAIAAAAAVLEISPPPQQPEQTPAAGPAPAAAAVTPAAPHRTDVPARARGVYGAPVGTKLDFRVEVATETSMSRPDGTPLRSGSFRTTGTMSIVVLGRRDGACAIRVSFADVVLSGSEAAADSGPTPFAGLREDLARGALLRMRDDGLLLGLRFADGFGPNNRNRLRALLTQSAFVVDSERSQWSGVEPDVSGMCEADYRWLGRGGDRRLEKCKRAFAPTTEGGPVPSVRHRAQATFDHELGWLSESRSDELLGLRVPDQELVVQVTTRAHQRLQTASRVPAACDDSLWQGAWQPVCAVPESSTAEQLEEAERRARDHIAPAELIAALAAALAADPDDVDALLDLRESLVRLLELWPARARELDARIRAEPAGSRLASLLVGAVGAAGTPECQDLLRSLATDAVLPDATRKLSLQCMVQVAAPTLHLLQDLATLAESAHADRDIAGTSMLILGALTQRSDAPDATVARLLALEGRARAGGLTEVWLDALGNAGHADAVPVAARYLEACDDPRRREQAVRALRKLRTPAARDVLVERAIRDGDPGVRAASIELLCAHADPTSLGRVGALLASETDPFVRQTALESLAECIGDPHARALVERLADGDPSPSLRARARQTLRS